MVVFEKPLQNKGLYPTILYSTIPYYTILYSTLLYSTLLFRDPVVVFDIIRNLRRPLTAAKAPREAPSDWRSSGGAVVKLLMILTCVCMYVCKYIYVCRYLYMYI